MDQVNSGSGLSIDQRCRDSKTRKILLCLCLLWIQPRLCISDSASFESTDSCSIYDKCGVRDFFRTCSCDSDCYRYRTCCEDAPEVNKMLNWSEHFHCYSRFTSSPVFAKNTCADDWQGDRAIREACVRTATDITSDLMSHVLVSSGTTNTTYWNWNCAMCNGENIPDLHFWTVQVSCVLDKVHMSVTDARETLHFDQVTQKWGIDEGGKFLACPISLYQPAHLNGRLRFCAPNMTSDCPLDWKDENVRNKCHSYHGERKMRTSKRYFKNVHCAHCNGVNFEDLDCYGRNYRPFSSDTPTFKIVYNLNLHRGELSNEYGRCESGMERYDPFLKKCRKLMCALRDPIPEDDVCASSAHESAKKSLFLYCLAILVSFLISYF